MPKEVNDIEKDAMELPPHDRALLVEHLLATLECGEDIDAEEVWLDEAEKRYKEYRAGKIGVKPADQVFAEARKKIT